MLSIVPLLAGGGLFETGAGGSAPKVSILYLCICYVYVYYIYYVLVVYVDY